MLVMNDWHPPAGSRSAILYAALVAIAVAAAAMRDENSRPAQPAVAPIHFLPQPIAFVLDSSESPERHAPETMAGGVAIFDYDGDGNLDIFFTNGAEITSLK